MGNCQRTKRLVPENASATSVITSATANETAPTQNMISKKKLSVAVSMSTDASQNVSAQNATSAHQRGVRTTTRRTSSHETFQTIQPTAPFS